MTAALRMLGGGRSGRHACRTLADFFIDFGGFWLGFSPAMLDAARWMPHLAVSPLGDPSG